MSIKRERIGEINYNTFGSKMQIINYLGKDNIDVYFEDYDYISKCRKYHDFKVGNIKCPYEPRFYNKGYMGQGIHNAKDDEKAYKVWCSMLLRCYDDEFHKKHTTYKDCVVCDEWLNFQNFAKWFYENYYEIDGEVIALDKDILSQNNKIYSPSTCIFVPQRINSIFTKRKGVKSHNNKYEACCCGIYLGIFDNRHDAFLMYKINKELLIQGVANEYKDKVPYRLYNEMIKYNVKEVI